MLCLAINLKICKDFFYLITVKQFWPESGDKDARSVAGLDSPRYPVFQWEQEDLSLSKVSQNNLPSILWILNKKI